MSTSITAELPRIISFFAVEALLILLNIYFIAKLKHYCSYVKAGTSLKMDWYLVASFVTLSLAILLRSTINLIIYVEELKFEATNTKPADDDDFNDWFKI
jgi:hypothetical protein